jgi:metal-responsive CopG/Arc/MetJ family transcriptional regulator
MTGASELRKVTLRLRPDQVDALDEAARTDGAGNRSSVARQVIDLGLTEMRRLAGRNDEARS